MTNYIASKIEKHDKVEQGNIISNVEFIQRAEICNEILEIQKIIFPKIYVLTQACDLSENYKNKERISKDTKNNNYDKYLISILVAPVYNAELLRYGKHLKKIYGEDSITERISSKPWGTLTNNKNPRYHFLDFSAVEGEVDSVIDFKHYFSVDFAILEDKVRQQPVVRVNELYREDISQRFASFLSRIGLP